jgi:hypothetical protein
MLKKLAVAALGVLVFGAVLPVNQVKALEPCSAPPSPDPGPRPDPGERPAPPTGLRILRGPAAELEPAFSMAAAGSAYDYFESLRSRPDCFVAYSMRSQTVIDSMETGAVSERRKPVVYDAGMDAARFSFFAPVSTDSQQKSVSIPISSGSLLITWDFRFDRFFAWSDGYLKIHKAWRLDPGPWMAFKTDYQRAAHVEGLAEFFMSLPSPRFLGPGTTREQREVLYPRLAEFFIQPDTWTRAWIFVQDIDRPVCYISVWIADQERDPIQLYDRLAMLPPEGGFGKFRLEYDTSGEMAENPDEMHSWDRNVVVLRNVPPSDIAGLLRRP